MDLEEAKRQFAPMWTIYDRPADQPDKFVVRVWYGLVGERESTIHGSLVAARESVWARGGGFCLGRKSDDDPCIVETWI